jgi:hypothetical protein
VSNRLSVIDTNVVLPGDTEEEGRQPAAFISAVTLGAAGATATTITRDDDAYAFEEQNFFCSRMGDVLVAGGETFRISACLPGATQPAPDVSHLYTLHKASCFSPATGRMVVGGSKSLGGLGVQYLSAGGASKAPTRHTLPIRLPDDEQEFTCCALSPGGGWVLLGTDAGEVHLAAAGPKRGAGAPVPAPPGAPGEGSGRAAQAAASSNTVVPRLVGRQYSYVTCCAFHPSRAYAATCR